MALCKLTSQKLDVSKEKTTLSLKYDIIDSSQLVSFNAWLMVSAKGDKVFDFSVGIVHSKMKTGCYDSKECDEKRERVRRSYFYGLAVDCANTGTRIEFKTKDKAQALAFIQGIRRIAPFEPEQFEQLAAYININGLPFELVFEKIEQLVKEGKPQQAFDEAQLADNLGYAEVFFKLGHLFKNAGYQQPAYVVFTNIVKVNPHYQSAQLEAAQLAPFALTGGMEQVMKEVFTHCCAAGDQGQPYIDAFFIRNSGFTQHNPPPTYLKNIQPNFETLHMLSNTLQHQNTIIQEQQKQIERLQKEVNKGKEAGVHWQAPHKTMNGVKETSTALEKYESKNDVALLTEKEKTKFSKRT